jgi:replicative DNA helicase
LTEDEKALIHRAAAKFYDLPIYVEDAMFDYADVVSSIRRNTRKNGVQMVYIDYVGLLEDRAYKGYSANDKISKISRAFVKVSATEKIEVVLLAQYNRVRVGRADPKPLNSDLRDSGSLEQDPQVIMHLYRPEKFGINEDSDGNSYRGVTIIVVSKNRLNNQGVGDIPVGYDNKRDGFAAITEQPAPTFNPLITAPLATDEDIPF